MYIWNFYGRINKNIDLLEYQHVSTVCVCGIEMLRHKVQWSIFLVGLECTISSSEACFLIAHLMCVFYYRSFYQLRLCLVIFSFHPFTSLMGILRMWQKYYLHDKVKKLFHARGMSLCSYHLFSDISEHVPYPKYITTDVEEFHIFFN